MIIAGVTSVRTDHEFILRYALSKIAWLNQICLKMSRLHCFKIYDAQVSNTIKPFDKFVVKRKQRPFNLFQEKISPSLSSGQWNAYSIEQANPTSYWSDTVKKEGDSGCSLYPLPAKGGSYPILFIIGLRIEVLASSWKNVARNAHKVI